MRRRPSRTSTASGSRRHAVALCSRWSLLPLFTFRYYLLHTRVSARERADAVPRLARRPPFYLGDFGPYLRAALT